MSRLVVEASVPAGNGRRAIRIPVAAHGWPADRDLALSIEIAEACRLGLVAIVNANDPRCDYSQVTFQVERDNEPF